ncbi:hypothetical protein ON010_g16646 [Phytophthora cinnamomi]|nr:hypothetical protein ON010_g16646 [Phytophthora cinnamomi]
MVRAPNLYARDTTPYKSTLLGPKWYDQQARDEPSTSGLVHAKWVLSFQERPIIQVKTIFPLKSKLCLLVLKSAGYRWVAAADLEEQRALVVVDHGQLHGDLDARQRLTATRVRTVRTVGAAARVAAVNGLTETARARRSVTEATHHHAEDQRQLLPLLLLLGPNCIVSRSLEPNGFSTGSSSLAISLSSGWRRLDMDIDCPRLPDIERHVAGLARHEVPRHAAAVVIARCSTRLEAAARVQLLFLGVVGLPATAGGRPTPRAAAGSWPLQSILNYMGRTKAQKLQSDGGRRQVGAGMPTRRDSPALIAERGCSCDCCGQGSTSSFNVLKQVSDHFGPPMSGANGSWSGRRGRQSKGNARSSTWLSLLNAPPRKQPSPDCSVTNNPQGETVPLASSLALGPMFWWAGCWAPVWRLQVEAGSYSCRLPPSLHRKRSAKRRHHSRSCDCVIHSKEILTRPWF